ncbi:BTB/POZ domain-containing protein [Hibiscus syriacus]|uniref:BTB/POZ domain-containing protein n=1 Tax=Hibiscus syriacus TaxID=106335 RepID=A0A6A3BG50_HIBSY|nr:BTB/POZ domain-containing protein [Hibiscus syriacus]
MEPCATTTMKEANWWVFKIKRNCNDQVEMNHERPVVKGYAQKEEQLDVKTVFLHGNHEEEIYMLQPEGFEEKEEKNLVCRLNNSLNSLSSLGNVCYLEFTSRAARFKQFFLHGNHEEEIYMLQPEGFEEKEEKNLVCRLNNSLYGLKKTLSGSLMFAMIYTRLDIVQVVGVMKYCKALRRRRQLRRYGIKKKSRKCKFLGYAIGVNGYRLWDPTSRKVIISRDVIFVEDKLQRKEKCGSVAKSETTQIHVEKEFEQGYSSKAEPTHNEQEPESFEAPTTHQSDRAPRCWYKRFDSFIMCLGYNRLNANPCAYFKRFCANGLPSDIIIEVDDMTFHLHKQGQKSSTATVGKQKQRETETEIEEETEEYQEQQDEEEEEEEGKGDRYQISLQGVPGGSDTFETAAKFSYGVKIDLSSSTIVPLRFAIEFLEMTDEYSEDNLISKIERFLSQSVFKSLKESIKALKSCESVMTFPESLGIVQRLIDSIASRASSIDLTLFGWPVNEGAIEAKDGASTQALWNGIETGLRRKALARTNNLESWFEDLAMLSLPLFKRFILMHRKDLSREVIESCLMCYAQKYIPGTSRSNRKPSSSLAAAISESEQRELLETIISNLPLEKTRSSTATRFLFGLLRAANILNSSEPSKAALEKKIGFQLEHATLDDLLIPSYSYLNETLYDIDCIERILGYFLDGLEERSATGIEAENEGNDYNIINGSRVPSLMLVGKLIDGYLSEIASDAKLKPNNFYNLAISFPDEARNFDDGLYRAVDVYLKGHPWIPESGREKICGVLDCQKPTLEACTHAAQNERLPLRAVVQVFFRAATTTPRDCRHVVTWGGRRK